MKKMKLTLCLLAAIAVASSVHAETWNCGEIDPTEPTGAYSASVKASLETISGDSVLRIYGNGAMAPFHQGIGYTEAQEPYVVTDAPWDHIAAGIKHVYVENGVQIIGDYAFYTMTQLQNIYISKSVTKLGEGFINNDFNGNIYCSATNPDKLPNAEAVLVPGSTVMPNYFLNANVYVAPGMVPSFVVMTWWMNFDVSISESVAAASVVTVPQDSLTDSKVQILVEVVNGADKYEVLVKSDDETDIHHFYTYYDPVTDKWVIEPIAGAPIAARRLPALRRDTVSRTTEVLQIDITNLQPATNYMYEVSALSADVVVSMQTGSFKTPAKQPTGFDEFVNEEMRKGKNLKIMRDGQIFIIRDGEWLDVTGRKID